MTNKIVTHGLCFNIILKSKLNTLLIQLRFPSEINKVAQVCKLFHYQSHDPQHFARKSFFFCALNFLIISTNNFVFKNSHRPRSFFVSSFFFSIKLYHSLHRLLCVTGVSLYFITSLQNLSKQKHKTFFTKKI